ncbi:MAG TPA: hypothetical protein VG815_05235 [Chloroflexota bacterium]|jgi:hypothetical protein|nr:hypothetical protein [Chloroflexota bacterium]
MSKGIRFFCYLAVPLLALSLPGFGVTALAQASPAMSPTTAVSQTLAGYNHPNKQSPCKANHYNYSACPLTNRLRTRLTKLSKLQFDPLCRCQIATKHISLSLISKGAKTARVKTVWTFTMPVKPESITMVEIKPAHSMGWLVSGTYCRGKPRTSIYGAAHACG